MCKYLYVYMNIRIHFKNLGKRFGFIRYIKKILRRYRYLDSSVIRLNSLSEEQSLRIGKVLGTGCVNLAAKNFPRPIRALHLPRTPTSSISSSTHPSIPTSLTLFVHHNQVNCLQRKAMLKHLMSLRWRWIMTQMWWCNRTPSLRPTSPIFAKV